MIEKDIIPKDEDFENYLYFEYNPKDCGRKQVFAHAKKKATELGVILTEDIFYGKIINSAELHYVAIKFEK